MNGSMRVFSFVAQSTIKSFSDEVKEFFDYLESNQDFPSDSQYLIGKAKHTSFFARLMLACSLKMLTIPVFQFGTEAVTGGSATMTASQFSASIG
jgi:xyloglucan-specific endo-beta-1,4-glucanase